MEGEHGQHGRDALHVPLPCDASWKWNILMSSLSFRTCALRLPRDAGTDVRRQVIIPMARPSTRRDQAGLGGEGGEEKGGRVTSFRFALKQTLSTRPQQLWPWHPWHKDGRDSIKEYLPGLTWRATPGTDRLSKFCFEGMWLEFTFTNIF